MPKKKEEKPKAKAAKAKDNTLSSTSLTSAAPKLDVEKCVGQLRKSISKINQIPVYRLKPTMLKSLILRSGTVKQKELTAMVQEVKKAREVALLKYYQQIGIVPQEEEGRPVIEYHDGNTVNALVSRGDAYTRTQVKVKV